MANEPTNNMIEFNNSSSQQRIWLEERLKNDAQSLSGSIDDETRTMLFKRLKQQETTITTTKHSSYIRYAAASILILLLTTPLYFGFNQIDAPLSDSALTVGTNTPFSNPVGEINKPEFVDDLIIDLGAEQKVASQQLESEYQAILSDMNKLKQRIVKL